MGKPSTDNDGYEENGRMSSFPLDISMSLCWTMRGQNAFLYQPSVKIWISELINLINSVHRARVQPEESPGGTQSGRPADRPAPWGRVRILWPPRKKKLSLAWRRSCWRSVHRLVSWCFILRRIMHLRPYRSWFNYILYDAEWEISMLNFVCMCVVGSV